MKVAIVVVFIIGYLAIALEYYIRLNKTAIALLTGILCWTLFVIADPGSTNSSSIASHHQLVVNELSDSFGEIASILFFLMGAMTIVELVDAHDGFRIITQRITTRNVRKLLWIVAWMTFFLSAVLDNLTTSIVMISLARKLIHLKDTRWLFAGVIIIAANAGGAWSPIGDITTTMLWIGGRISSDGVVSSLMLPSIVCLLVPLTYLTFRMKGNLEPIAEAKERPSMGGDIIFFAGVGALLFVPFFKAITDLPPYMGMLLGLGILWIISELINPSLDESDREKYSAASALSRIDISSVLFFFGILLAVAALQSNQLLNSFANYLMTTIGNESVIVTFLGIASAIVDNVPLVAASMGMFPLEAYHVDHAIWTYLAYCAGTGGSLLIIGSAAGVAVMGIEKIDFVWYLRKITVPALLGFLGGAGSYLVFSGWS